MLTYAILKIFSKVMKSYEIMPGGSPAKCAQNVIRTIKILESLGFYINQK